MSKMILKRSSLLTVMYYDYFVYLCTRAVSVMYNRSKEERKKRKRNDSIYFNTNYRTEMKLLPIIMDYCRLQFNVLK